MKITFPNFGNYDIALKTMLERIGFEVIPPQKTTLRDIEKGVEISPEMFCFPFKVNMGNYLASIEKGADTFLMWRNEGGICRQRYYGVVQEKVLKGFQKKISFVNLGRNDIFQKLRELSGASFLKIMESALFFIQEAIFIEKIEKLARFYRPKEKQEGVTDRILDSCLEKLKKIKTRREFSKLRKELRKEFADIQTDENRKILKVGLIGEIYTVIDGAVNNELEKKLGRMGIEVHRKLTLTEFLKHHIFPWASKKIEKKIRPYLKTEVGGHGIFSVAETMDYAEERFDGIIHLLPFGCMPEATVRPILQKISQEKNIPLLSISIDEQTADTGVQTRLEAFVDLLWSKKNNR